MRRIVFLFIWLFVFFMPWENVIIIKDLGTLAKMVGIMSIILGGLLIIIRGKIKWNAFHIIAFVFSIWSWFSIIWSINSQSTMARSITYIGLCLITLAIYQIIDSEKDVYYLMWSYILGVWIVSLDTIMCYFHGIEVSYYRYAAKGFNLNDLAFYVIFSIPMSWYLGQKTNSILRRTISWGLIPVAVTTSLLTASRSGFVGLGLCAFYIMLSIIKKPNWKYILTAISLVGITVVVGVNFVPQPIYERFATIPYEIFYGTLDERTLIWRAGLHIWSLSPILGVGSGAFSDSVASILGYPFASHNMLIGIGAECGLIGLALWLGMIWLSFAKIFVASRDERNLWLILFSILFLALLTQNFEWRKTTWFLMVLALIHLKVKKREEL